MRAFIVLIAGAALLAGCGSDSSTSTPDSTSRSTTATSTSKPADADVSALYFTAGEQLKPVPTAAPDPEQAVRALLAGPGSKAPKNAGTEIPGGTRLQGVAVDDDGTATVRVTKEFTGGIPDDAAQRTADQQAELDARLAQVTYTLDQFDNVKSTRLVLGRPGRSGIVSLPHSARNETWST